MSNATQLWPGARMRAFFRAHIRRETSLDEAAAERLSEALTKAVNRMLVWDAHAGEQPPAEPQDLTSGVPEKPVIGKLEFDPYEFSAMVVLVKAGRDALVKRLGEIKSAEHLKALADAQHLALDPKLKKRDDLRKAIITATEQRLADRKAAAS